VTLALRAEGHPEVDVVVKQGSDRQLECRRHLRERADRRTPRRGLAEPGSPAAFLSRYIAAMCNRYESPKIKEIERFWHIGGRQELQDKRSVMRRALRSLGLPDRVLPKP